MLDIQALRVPTTSERKLKTEMLGSLSHLENVHPLSQHLVLETVGKTAILTIIAAALNDDAGRLAGRGQNKSCVQ